MVLGMPRGLCSISWEILEDVERIASGIPWMCISTSLRIPGRGRVLENIKGILMIKEEHPCYPQANTEDVLKHVLMMPLQ